MNWVELAAGAGYELASLLNTREGKEFAKKILNNRQEVRDEENKPSLEDKEQYPNLKDKHFRNNSSIDELNNKLFDLVTAVRTAARA